MLKSPQVQRYVRKKFMFYSITLTIFVLVLVSKITNNNITKNQTNIWTTLNLKFKYHSVKKVLIQHKRITMYPIKFTAGTPFTGVGLVPPHAPGSISPVPTASTSGPRTPTTYQPPRPKQNFTNKIKTLLSIPLSKFLELFSIQPVFESRIYSVFFFIIILFWISRVSGVSPAESEEQTKGESQQSYCSLHRNTLRAIQVRLRSL